MEHRSMLHQILTAIPGVNAVYFNPPTNVKMVYPCIRYKVDGESPTFADNRKYCKRMRYLLTVIDHDPESRIASAVMDLPYSKLNRVYTADNLYHYQITLYY